MNGELNHYPAKRQLPKKVITRGKDDEKAL
jgi:hypothetical protein